MADMSGVFVPLERLRQLETLEAQLPAMLAKAETDALEKHKKEKLAKLHVLRETDPKAYSDNMLKKYHANKDEINARRREQYKAKKAVVATPA